MPNEVRRTSPKKSSVKKPNGGDASSDRKDWRNESELLLEIVEEAELVGDDVKPKVPDSR